MLVYDGDCRFCIAGVSVFRRWFEPSAPSVAWQSADLASLGLTAEQCKEAVQWSASGRRESGADAVAAWLRTGRRLRPLVALFPLLLPVGRRVYPIVARHRDPLGRLLRL